MSSNPIVDTYLKYFHAVRATTPELHDLAFNIRYQVYCQEFKYEPEQNFPDQRERDEYDEQSHHCLFIHKPTGIAAGCLRLIAADRDNAILPLPFERFCSPSVDPACYKMLQDFNKRLKYGEFSRLAVPSHFRRRKEDEKKPISIPDDQGSGGGKRLPFPVLPIGLMLCAFAIMLSDGYDYGYCMIEARLARMFLRHSLAFEQIGDFVDYHGLRGPFVITRENILSKLSPEVYEYMEVIQEQLAK